MEFRILGPLQALSDGAPVDLGPHKQRSLLAFLLLSANRVVPTDRILEELWGDDCAAIVEMPDQAPRTQPRSRALLGHARSLHSFVAIPVSILTGWISEVVYVSVLSLGAGVGALVCVASDPCGGGSARRDSAVRGGSR